MKYPMASNFLIYEKFGSKQCKIIDWLNDEEYIVDVNVAVFLKKLDGKTNPYRIKCRMSKAEIKTTLEKLSELELLRDSMTLSAGLGTCSRTICIPKWTTKKRFWAFVSNRLLVLLFIPMVIIGLFLAKNYEMNFNMRTAVIGDLIGLFFGVVLHEWSHAAACISYGGRVFEFGIMISHFVPGAYTSMDTSSVKKKRQNVQINAAGIETNLMLAGIFLIISSFTSVFCDELYFAGIVNIVLAILNLAFIDGIDGMCMISSAFGVEGLKKKINKTVRSTTARRKMASSGTSGKAVVIFCYVIYYQPILILPVIYLFEYLYFL